MIHQAELDCIKTQAVEEYPRVCCGVVLVSARMPDNRLLIPCRNIQDEMHAEDPTQFPLTSRDGYYVSPIDLCRIAKLEVEGYQVSVVYYSRVDKDASFSEISKRGAIADGRVMHPDAVYLTISVVRGIAVDVGAFKWNPVLQDFARRNCVEPQI